MGDVAFGEGAPAGQGIAQILQPALIAGRGPESQIGLALGSQRPHAVKRQPIVFIEIGTQLVHQRLHAFLLFPVVADRRTVNPARIAAGVTNGAHDLEVLDGPFPPARGGLGDLLELRLIGVVDRKLERIETGLHALIHLAGIGQGAVGGEEHIGETRRLGHPDGVRQPVAHERFADVEHAEFFHAGGAHLPAQSAEQGPVHFPAVLEAQAMGAESAPIVTLAGDLDLDGAGRRQDIVSIGRRNIGNGIDARGNHFFLPTIRNSFRSMFWN